MTNRFMKSHVPAVALAAALIGTTALSLAQTSRRPVPPRRSPVSRLQANPDRYSSSTDSRDARNLIEDLENSTPEEVRAGRIDRYFTDPAVIITNGQMHHIDWSRVRQERPLDREPADRNAAPRVRADQRDADARDRADQRNTDVHIESFETRRIDPRTMVVMYTAVIPGDNGATRQPVVATMVREPGRSGWRVASYTAENAALPGEAADNTDQDRLPAP